MKRSLSLQSIILSLFAAILFYSELHSTSLNGTAGVVYQDQHYVFSNGDIAKGFVRLNGGFTILPNARATMDLVTSVSRGIDLRVTGELQLVNHLVLDNGVTFSTGGYLNGRGHALDFSGTFTLPHSQVLHIVTDTVIDGQGGMLLFSPNAHLFVEQNATLTLRNMAIHATRNNKLIPILRCGGNGARIALDNVKIGLANDFVFNQGRLFVHNDVVVTGTSTFIYTSPMPLLVDSYGMLTFDIGSGFSFAPSSTDQRLFVLKDQTSGLFFNGSTFNATSTGVRFTKGNIFFDNKVVINSKTDVEVNGATALTSTHYGDAWDAMSWSPDGKHLVVGGFWADPDGSMIFNVNDAVVLYKLVGSTLVTVTSQSFGTEPFSRVFGLDWSPDGRFLTVTGERGTAGLGGFSTDATFRLYEFNGSVLKPVTSLIAPSNFFSDTTRAKWRPDQRYISISGEDSGGVDILIYKFNGTSLSLTTSRETGINYEASWSPDGKFLAIGSLVPVSGGSSGFANLDHIRIYSFDGSTLTPITSQAYGPFLVTTSVRKVSWSPDGKFLLVAGVGATAVGGFANTHNVRIYAFNGTSLMAQASFNGANPAAWHPSGKYITCQNSTQTSQQILRFDGTTLTSIASVIPTASPQPNRVDTGWDPTGTILTCGSSFVDLFTTTFINSLVQPFSTGVIFGDSAAGSASNCAVEVLSAAHVTINGVVCDDSV